MLALSDTHDYSFLRIPYLERGEKITDQSDYQKPSELSRLSKY